MRRGGIIIANELTTKTDFLTLTFGLTDGWWLYDDPQWRMPGGRVLNVLRQPMHMQNSYWMTPLKLMPVWQTASHHTLHTPEFAHQDTAGLVGAHIDIKITLPGRLAAHQPHQLAGAAGGAGLPARAGVWLRCACAPAAGPPVRRAWRQRRRHPQARLCGCCGIQGPQACSGAHAHAAFHCGACSCQRTRCCPDIAGEQYFPVADVISTAVRGSICHRAVLVAYFQSQCIVWLQELQRVVDELLGQPVPSDQPLMEAGLDSIGGCIRCIAA